MVDTSYTHEFAEVKIAANAAEQVRKVMRQTGWDVRQALDWIFINAVTDVPVRAMAPEANRGWVQLIRNTITSNKFRVNDVVQVSMPIGDETEGDVKLVGRVYGFAPQGVAVILTDRSMAEAKMYGVRVNKDDLWDHDSIEIL